MGENAAAAIADFVVVDMFANYCTGREDVKTAMASAERSRQAHLPLRQSPARSSAPACFYLKSPELTPGAR